VPHDAQTRVAVAVVSWNTRDLLRACVESLRADADAGRAEVWVVDNASSDDSADMVRSDFGWARLVALDENVGFGAAVNRVAAQTDAPWIAPANADVEVEPEALGTLVQAGARDPGAGAVAPRLILPDGSTQHSVYRFPTVPFTAAFNGGLYRVSRRASEAMLLEGMWDAARPRVVDWAIAALIVVRRAAWDAAGGFDEGQWMYAEDLDLGWRLAAAGWHTRYEPSARVRHHASAATSQAWGDERTARWQRATYEWMLRRRGVVRTRTAAALNVGGALARAAMFPRARQANLGWAKLHRMGLELRP
jgi:N-acetylglucosaminyl-diphospho-decaprenol L-rhamnosyltransferase